MSDRESVLSEQGTIDNIDAPDAPNHEPHDEGMNIDDDVNKWHMKTFEADTFLEASSM
nr:hypothetical protein [Tanacetum cinerariifolium]